LSPKKTFKFFFLKENNHMTIIKIFHQILKDRNSKELIYKNLLTLTLKIA
jgi:hypothetical protein